MNAYECLVDGTFKVVLGQVLIQLCTGIVDFL